MPMSRPKITHKPRTRGPVGEVAVRKIPLTWKDLAKSFQDDARDRFGTNAEQRIEVISRGSYREV